MIVLIYCTMLYIYTRSRGAHGWKRVFGVKRCLYNEMSLAVANDVII
jgi:hypothetical protein